MGLFLFIDGPALVCGWVNFPMLWPHTPVQTKLKCPPPPRSSPTQFPTQQSYTYCTPSLRRRQSQSTKENPLTGLSDLSSIENALPVVTNTSSIESFPKVAALLRRDKLSFSIINRSSIFIPFSSSAIMAAILKG